MRFYQSLKLAAGACLIGLALAIPAGAATMDGATIRATADFPFIPGTTTAGPVDRVVGAGTEFVDGDFLPFFGPSFDFAGDTISITHAATGHSSGTFNGYTFNDLNGTLNDFIGFSVVSDTTGFFSGDLSRIFFDANNLFINFQSLFFSTSDELIVLRVQMADSTAVPIPAALPLLAGGLGMMGLVGWRRKRKASATA